MWAGGRGRGYVGLLALNCSINRSGQGSEQQGLLEDEAWSCSPLFWTDSGFWSEGRKKRKNSPGHGKRLSDHNKDSYYNTVSLRDAHCQASHDAILSMAYASIVQILTEAQQELRITSVTHHSLPLTTDKHFTLSSNLRINPYMVYELPHDLMLLLLIIQISNALEHA